MAEADTKKWLRPFLKPMMPTFREVVIMSAFVNLVALATPVFTMQVYDRVVFHAGISTLWGLVIGMVFVILFDTVLKLSRSRIMQTVALRVDVLIGRKLFDKVMSLPMAELESKPASHWQLLYRDVDTVRNTVSGASAVLLADLPFVILFFVLIFVIATPVAWVLLVIVPIFTYVAWRSAAEMSQANQEERESSASRDELIAEMIGGRTTIKALALDRAMRPVWEQRHADNIAQAMNRGAKTDFYSNLGGALTMGTTVLMTTVGALAIVNQDMTMGALIAANMLSGRLLGPLNQLVQQWRTFNSFKQAVERLGEAFETESERLESEVAMETPKGEIKVENGVFSYAPELKPVLNNVSINLPAGGIHALVGRNGSGKSTLLKVIQGLYRPTTGRVLIDGADIAQFTRSELADWMGYVPQECVLFAGTIRENITHRHPDATDDEVIKAATASGVHQFIIDMPDGYASDIGEAGRRLSGGQRQRIAIARALLRDPAVLMMDEPSASLDRQAEQALRATLREISKERSVILVTHSPILLAACDDLVALDGGRVALAGPAKEILPRLFGQNPLEQDKGGPPPDQPSGPPPEKGGGKPQAPKPEAAPPPKAAAPQAPAAPQKPAAAQKPPSEPGQLPAGTPTAPKAQAPAPEKAKTADSAPVPKGKGRRPKQPPPGQPGAPARAAAAQQQRPAPAAPTAPSSGGPAPSLEQMAQAARQLPPNPQQAQPPAPQAPARPPQQQQPQAPRSAQAAQQGPTTQQAPARAPAPQQAPPQPQRPAQQAPAAPAPAPAPAPAQATGAPPAKPARPAARPRPTPPAAGPRDPYRDVLDTLDGPRKRD